MDDCAARLRASCAAALQVPGKMDPDEMAFLAALAAQVPPGGHIVEIGPLYGRSTCVMGRANPEAQITSIDPFEDVAWTRAYAREHHGIPRFCRAAFARYTADLPRTQVIEGYSPEAATGWAEPIDMYFEDAVHGNPTLRRNMTFWSAHVRPGGIVCGHDYTLRFPDVKREADALAARWGTTLHVVGTLWALRKPGRAKTAALALPLPGAANLSVRTKTKRGGLHSAPAGHWCGAHMEADRLLWMQVDPPELPPGVLLEYRVAHPAHGASPWMQAGQKARLVDRAGKTRPISRVAARLTGHTDLQIGCRVSARQIGKGGAARSGISGWAYDGTWAQVHSASAPINALTLAVLDAAPPDAQAAFPTKGLLPPRVLRAMRRLGPRGTPLFR